MTMLGRDRKVKPSLIEPPGIVVTAEVDRGTRAGVADAAAYEPIVKGAIDGLTAAGWWSDDSVVEAIVFQKPARGNPRIASGLVELTLTVVRLDDARVKSQSVQHSTGG